MKRIHTHPLLALGIFILLSFQIMQAQPISTFDATAESWSTVGDPGSSPGATYSSIGGNPGGCIKGTDESTGTWYWNGPNSGQWHGDLSEFYSCDLTFDLKQSASLIPINAYDVMIIRGDDAHIVYNTPYNPGTTWTAYTVPFTETGWMWNDIGGAAVSSDEFIDFLSDVKRIRIRAEYSGLSYETNYLDNLIVVCTVEILPVELSQFYATEVEPSKLELNWLTESETNCKGFQIEKSITGLVYDSIGYLDGNGTTTFSNSYQFMDDQFYTGAYYRLKQIDQNYKISYSDLIYAEPEVPITLDQIQQIFPNPSQGVFQIQSNSSVRNIEVRDLFGRIVFLQNFEGNQSYIEMQLQFLSNGIYELTMTNAIGSKTQQITIAK